MYSKITNRPDLGSDVASRLAARSEEFRGDPLGAGIRTLARGPETAPGFKLPQSPDAEPSASLLVLPDPRGIATALRRYSEISLEETNKSASMLKRTDNKYIVNKTSLLKILEDLREEFRILKIGGRDVFSYRSCYFDDHGQCFREHQQGRRQRFKVRTRLYVESDKAYFEVKLKGKRGQTDKSRKTCDRFLDFAVTADDREMLHKLYEESYGKEFRYDMTPALHVTYNRFTLVSAAGGERITVDFNLGFETPAGGRAQVGDDFIIVETKSENGRGRSDRILKHNRIRQAEGCSKYCIGMVLTGEVQHYNRFRAIVKTVRSRMEDPEAGLGETCRVDPITSAFRPIRCAR